MDYEKILETRKSKILFMKEVMGLELLDLLADKTIIEVMRNQDGSIWIERMGTGFEKTNIQINDLQCKQIIEVIASFNDKVANYESPIVSAILPINGERFEGVLGEAVGNHPIFAIRKNSSKIISLMEYVANNTLTETQAKYIEKAMKDKKNILIVGGTSTGKTTFANACIQTLRDSEDRIIILEETSELKCEVLNYNKMIVTDVVSMRDLLRSTMRLNPDRIMVGELRKGEETIELLKAWNSGHPGGITTIHANDSQAGLQKLEQYLAEVSNRDQKPIILEAINVIVNLVKEGNYRKVKEIVEIKGFDYKQQEYILKKIN